MDVVDENFFKRLPVTEVVSNLETAARNNVCQATGLKPESLPDPLLTKEDVATAVEPLRKAVTAEVAALQTSFQKTLEAERQEHREELNKRRRLDSDCGSDEEDDDDVVGTYDCEDGHVCDDPYNCEDGRVVPYELEQMKDNEKLAYAKVYLKNELKKAQEQLDSSFMLASKTGSCISFRIYEDLSPDQFTITPAPKKITDNDNTILEFLKIKKYRFDTSSVDNCDFYFAGFISKACPNYKYDGTHKIAASNNPYGFQDMMKLTKEGVGFREYEEYGLFHYPNTLGNDLGRIYVVALLLRGHAFSDEDYTRMQNDLQKLSTRAW